MSYYHPNQKPMRWFWCGIVTQVLSPKNLGWVIIPQIGLVKTIPRITRHPSPKIVTMIGGF